VRPLGDVELDAGAVERAILDRFAQVMSTDRALPLPKASGCIPSARLDE